PTGKAGRRGERVGGLAAPLARGRRELPGPEGQRRLPLAAGRAHQHRGPHPGGTWLLHCQRAELQAASRIGAFQRHRVAVRLPEGGVLRGGAGRARAAAHHGSLTSASAKLALMSEAVVVSFARTPVADAFKGALAQTPIVELGKIAIAEALKRSGVAPDDVDDVVMGEVLQGGGALARYVALALCLWPDSPGVAMTRQCGSGRQPVNAAAASIKAGMDKVVIAGGLERMTHTVSGCIPDSHPETPDAPTRNMGATVGDNPADRCNTTHEAMAQ